MRKKIAVIVAVVLIICLLGWRFWPHSFSTVISVEKNTLTNIACHVSVMGVEKGKPFINTYMLSELSPQDTDFEKIVEILDSSDYCQDFRNLLPWKIDSVGANNTNLSATVVLVWGNGENESCFISLYDRSVISISFENEAGLRVYHPTNRKMLKTLAEYLQTHGNTE